MVSKEYAKEYAKEYGDKTKNNDFTDLVNIDI